MPRQPQESGSSRRQPVLKHWLLGLAALVLGLGPLALAGCSSDAAIAKRQAEARRMTQSLEIPEVPPQYRLQPGDKLTIKLFYNPELSELEVPIRPDGRIALQLIGEAQAAEKTVEQFQQLLEEQFGQFIKQPEVAVMVTSFSNQRVFVGGEVQRPGLIDRAPDLTALQSIIMAGGQRDTAEMRNVVIIRNQGNTKPLILLVDLASGIQNLAGHEDVRLEPLDIVFVPKSRIAEVNQFVDQYINKVLPFSRNVGVQYTYGDFTP